MGYRGKFEYAAQRKIRSRNTRLYRLAHWPIWIWVFFIAPGPWTFELFASGFHRTHVLWLLAVLVGTGIAGLRGRLPGVEPGPYIIRFDEDKPNPLYRRVCYTFAWNAVVNFALLNLVGLLWAAATGVWKLKQIYQFGYLPILLVFVLLGAFGRLPRVGRSTRGEGTERRYFYGAVWAVVFSQSVLLLLWQWLPLTRESAAVKLLVFCVCLALMGLAAMRGTLPRTRPIMPGEVMVAD